MSHFIEVIGLTPDPAGWPVWARELAAQARVLVGGKRLLELFPEHPGPKIELRAPLAQALETLARYGDQGLKILVLADGDPLFYGIGRLLLERFAPQDLRFHPGVTAVAQAAARLKRPWQGQPVVSLHGRDDFGPLLAALAHQGMVWVYTPGGEAPAEVARLLIEQGLDDARIWIFEDMGLPGENLRQLTPRQTMERTFAALNLLLVEVPGDGPCLAIQDLFMAPLAPESGLRSKWPVRACALASLNLRPRDVFWDVGSASGTMAIEASARLPQGAVWAVERDPARIISLRENIKKAKAWQVRVVCGEAPQALRDLPDPDRIFVGGGVSQGVLPPLCARLKPGGRLVANVVLLSSLTQGLEVFKNLGWPLDVAQIQASTSRPLAGDLRLSAQNPVFVITADKPMQPLSVN